MARVDPLGGSAGLLPLIPDDEFEAPPLPREHPKWVKDALAVSHRARKALAQVRPAALRIFTFWEHRSHAIFIGRRSLSIDSAGSYRLE